MRGNRMLALLLILALLGIIPAALAEAPSVDMIDSALEQEAIDLPVEEEIILDDIDQGLALDLPEDELYLAEATEASSSAAGSGEMVGYYTPAGGKNNDALFAGYVDSLFGKGLKPNGYVGSRLTGVARKLYNHLLPKMQKVAAGKLTNTAFDIPESVAGYSDWNDVCNSIGRIIDALLADCPYDLYWYDKTAPTQYGYNEGLYIWFPVASEYAKGTYTTNASKIKSAQKAVTNAKNVVQKYAGVSDYKKLCGYRDYICKAVNYYDEAAYDPSMPYGNPWQLIWVFDGNSKTNVVCEGYAKAFQYLCDLSNFKGNIQSRIVGGDAQDSGGSGPHMWNLITMDDGKNYHVDITFVDGGMSSAFLAGATSTGDGYYIVANEVTYIFDRETLNAYPARLLKPTSKNYDPAKPKPTGIAITKGKSATLYMGNTLTLKTKLTPSNVATTLTWTSSQKTVATVSSKGVVTPKKAGSTVITVKTANGKTAKITVKVVDASSVKLKKGTTDLKKGKTIGLKPGKSVTLKALVTPSKVKTKLTWTSSQKTVTVKDGVVKVSAKAKAGTKAKITVKTANGKSTYIYILVK